ncbi:hypothetical protein ABMA27_010666 [Loxostege sticticalis]|uniref:Secreted protein n=1 Tax=Loxostege sticticalis TaxID=481309 RepID=A0ABR3H3W8_LOXSC
MYFCFLHVLSSTYVISRIEPGGTASQSKLIRTLNYLRWDGGRSHQRSCAARKGGGRSFQHRDAANLKEPRNATVRCFGVAKTWVHSLLGYLLQCRAHSSFRKRYLGFIVVMTPNIMVVKCSLLRASIFIMFASLRYGVICDRGGIVKQNRAQAFCTL